MSRTGRGRSSFIYSTAKPPAETGRKRKRSPGSSATYPEEAAAGSSVTGTHSGPRGLTSKVQRTEAQFDDDEFDDNIGAAALEQYELTQRTSNLTTTSTTGQAASSVRTTSTSSATTRTSKLSNPYHQEHKPQTTIPPARPASPHSLQQALERLQNENLTKDGEVKILRDKNIGLLKQLREREEQMQVMQTSFNSEKKELQTRLTKENSSIMTELQFKKQEVSSLRDKCLLLEQHSRSPGTSKPVPTSKSVKTGGSSSRASADFLSTESFMPSQATSSEVTPVHVRPKRSTRERSVSISDKKTEPKSKKSRVSRSPTTTPSDTLSGRRSSKSFKSGGLGNKPLTIDPATVLSVQSNELDNTQLLMLLTRRDLLMPPVFLTSDEHEAPPPPPVVSSEKDSQSSDDESSPTLSESSQSDLTGLLSLLRLQPKSKPFSGSFATPVRSLDLSLKDSSSQSAVDSSLAVCTPVGPKRLQLSKSHTLARTDTTRLKQEQGGSSLVKSFNTPLYVGNEKRMSSLLYSVDKSGLEKSIGVMLQSADRSSVSRVDSNTSFCPNMLYSRMPVQNSNFDLLKRIATTVLQYHAEQSFKAKGTINTNTSEIGDSSDSSIGTGSHKSLSSSGSTGSSKSSSDIFCPLRCDQELVFKFLDILDTLVSYCPSLRDLILIQPPKFTLDSRPGSSFGTHDSTIISASLEGTDCEKFRSKTLLTSDLEEVTRRLSFVREGSNAPASPAKECSPSVEGKVWKEQQLANVQRPLCSLSSDAWTRKEDTPQHAGPQEVSFFVPESSRRRVGDVGGLFGALLEMPAPPWRESPRNIVVCLRILTALAEHCSEDTLQQFSSLLEEDVIGVCLDKDDPLIVFSTLSLLVPLVHSPLLVGLLCHNSPCVPVSCYDICLQTLPDPEHRDSGYTNQLQVVRLLSEALVTENGASALLTSSCQCHNELLKTLVLLLSHLIDSVDETSQWTQQELTLVLETVSLMHKVCVHDNYFDTHLMECEHTYTSVLHSLSWLLPTHHTPLREVIMVTDLLEYADEVEDSEESDRMDTSN